jgi:aliphatic sulfonates family ABC transporter substrate-binding protein
LYFTVAGENALRAYRWPGNIRELENVVHHAVLVTQAAAIDTDDLGLNSSPVPEAEPSPVLPEVDREFEAVLLRLFQHYRTGVYEQVSRLLMTTAYRECKQNQLETGRLLGLSRNVVRARLLELGVLEAGVRGRDKSLPQQTSSRARTDSRVYPSELRVGFQKFGSSMILKARGSLEQRLNPLGINVLWQEFSSGLPMLEALNAGALDFAATGETPPVIAQAARDSQFVYLGYQQASPRAEAIVVHRQSGIQSVTDLRGRRVAVAQGSNAHYLLLKVLMQAGMTLGDIDLRYVLPNSARSAFEQHEIDAWAIWDFHLAVAEVVLDARTLVNGTGLVDNFEIFSSRRAFSEQQPLIVEMLLEEISNASHWACLNPEAAAEQIAPGIGVEPLVLEQAFSRRGTGLRAAGPELEDNQRRIREFVEGN